MMPVVRINDATFTDLSTLKTWFGTKSPSETIDRIVREAMEELGIVRDDEEDGSEQSSSSEVLSFETTPSLAFTKPLAASVNGKPIQNPKWASILLAMVAEVKLKGISGEKLVSALSVPAKATKFDDEGYRFHPELGISIQGQSAADAWKEIDRLAKKWRIPVTVEFIWRDNRKAQFPRKNGILRSGGN